MRIQRTAFVVAIALSCALVLLTQSNVQAQSKPKLTLDEFFNSVGFNALEISPDGNSVVIGTERADWGQQIYRSDLWLYHDDGKAGAAAGNLIQLTQSGHDSEPKWSPDGRWIAFVSERKTAADKSGDSDSDAKDDASSQIYLISPNGGEAFPITQGDEDVHAFAWSADSQTIFFATRQPWTKKQQDDYKKAWKDVVQYRTAERGDTIFALDVAAAIARHAAAPSKSETDSSKDKDKDKEKDDFTPGARAIATTPLRVDSLLTSPDGRKLAFVSNAINQRQEKVEDVEIYTVDLTNVAQAPSPAGSNPDAALTQPRRITHNQAVEGRLRWASDSRHIFFSVEVGDVTGPYRDLQPHLYWVDTKSDTEKSGTEKSGTDSGAVEQWSKDFIGPVERYAVTSSNVLASARVGTEVQMYSVAKPSESLHRLSGWPGTYAAISVAPRIRLASFFFTLRWTSPRKFTSPRALLTSIRPAPSRNSTNSSPNATCRKASPSNGKPTTALPSKAC